MLKLIGLVLKLALFSFFVLVLGNWVRWDGKTISDQVKLRMSHADEYEIIGSVKTWADQLTQDAKQGFHKKIDRVAAQEEISPSERQKLKALIRELNSSHKRD